MDIYVDKELRHTSRVDAENNLWSDLGLRGSDPQKDEPANDATGSSVFRSSASCVVMHHHVTTL